MNCWVQGTINSGTPGLLSLTAVVISPLPFHLESSLLEDVLEQHLARQLDRQQLRKQVRERRRALSPVQQQRAALRLAQALALRPFFRRARRIAVYVANDGELDPGLLARRAVEMGKEIFLPVLQRTSPSLRFALYRPGDKLLPNRFGIPEPLPRAPRLPANQLDVVCMPLVGFDEKGNRLGMGGGFYDRTFAYRLTLPAARPLLVGLAHECQRLPTLPVQEWDVPLDVIATDVDVRLISKN